MRWTIGGTEVVRVEESVQTSFKPETLFPAFTREALAEHKAWMVPEFFDLAEDRFRTSVHTFVVRTRHHTILIDTCGGNHKNRPYLPRFHEKGHPWLERLKAAGVAPGEVDFVMCTHLHLDHVGWNTQLVDGRWVPTFPNAKYLFHRKELDRWNPQHPTYTFSPLNEFVWEDSVAPVIAAGQAQVIDDGYTLDDTLTVEPAPGHTLGHVRIRLRDGGAQAIFSGDLMHVPLQVYYPHWHTCLDDAPEAGVESRIALLETCVETNALLLPTHFASPHCCRIACRTAGFSIDWPARN
jgi:glyoxylase-like metal-dependent hydrolase (beta-lactamase superfamily II)